MARNPASVRTESTSALDAEGLVNGDQPTPNFPLTVGNDARTEQIRQAAYARSEQRGFEAGHEEEDWLAAEAEVDRANSSTSGIPQ